MIAAFFGQYIDKSGKEDLGGFGEILGQSVGDGTIGINGIELFSIIILKLDALFPHGGKGTEQFTSLGGILDHEVKLGLSG